jgi:hypothetical protein
MLSNSPKPSLEPKRLEWVYHEYRTLVPAHNLPGDCIIACKVSLIIYIDLAYTVSR